MALTVFYNPWNHVDTAFKISWVLNTSRESAKTQWEASVFHKHANHPPSCITLVHDTKTLALEHYLTSTTMLPKSVITGPSFLKALLISGSPPRATNERNTGEMAKGRTSTCKKEDMKAWETSVKPDSQDQAFCSAKQIQETTFK